MSAYCAPLRYNFSKLERRADYEIGHKLGQLDTNYAFSLGENFFKKSANVNFVYFMYHITILQCLKKIIEVDHKIKVCIIFGQIDLEIRFCNFGPNRDQIAGFSYSCSNKGEPSTSQKFALIPPS